MNGTGRHGEKDCGVLVACLELDCDVVGVVLDDLTALWEVLGTFIAPVVSSTHVGKFARSGIHRDDDHNGKLINGVVRDGVDVPQVGTHTWNCE